MDHEQMEARLTFALDTVECISDELARTKRELDKARRENAQLRRQLEQQTPRAQIRRAMGME